MLRAATLGAVIGFGLSLVGYGIVAATLQHGHVETVGAWFVRLTFPYSALFDWVAVKLPRGPSFYVGVVAPIWLAPALQGATVALGVTAVRRALRSWRKTR